eukprot:m.42482 g.42482  ORF g.42482 m.42482 type:complete len:544 (-) comp5729_c0_seq2:43-1674(-)
MPSLSRVLRSRERGTGIHAADLEGSRSFIQRLYLSEKLMGHSGCVNTVQWDSEGNYLVSGSDDRMVCIWSFWNKKQLHRIPTGHSNNIFCAKFVPGQLDKIATAAGDGQLRLVHVERQYADELVRADGVMLKIAFAPESPAVCLATSMDGSLRMVDLRSDPLTHSRITWRRGLSGVAFDPFRPSVCAIGVDDGTVALLDMRFAGGHEDHKALVSIPAPETRQRMLQRGESLDREETPSGLDFSTTHAHELIVNYRDGPLRLYSTRNDSQPGRMLMQSYTGRRNVDTFAKDVSFLHGGRYIGSGGDCGNLFVWDKATGQLVYKALGDSSVVNCVCPHPSQLDVITAGIDSDIKWWTLGATPVPLSLETTETLTSSLQSRMRMGEVISADEAEGKLAEANAHRAVGNEFFRTEKYTEALVEYEKGLAAIRGRMSRGDLIAAQTQARLLILGNTAACHIKLENFSEALAACTQAIAIDKNNAKARFRRAQAHIELGQPKDALADIHVARANGGDAAALDGLERVARERLREERRAETALYSRMFRS